MNIGKAVKKVLIDKDMSQTDLANKMGINRATISLLCSQEVCSGKMLRDVSEALEMKASELVALGECD